ncbi:MAG: phospholipase D-like domain-containing protein [Chloroflexi bacterium]|nr:phospholipase D-like domain-containing protein [Chloroflexota bacterium]
MQTLIWNSDGSTLAHVLETELPLASRVDIAVAFLKRSGFKALQDQFKRALERGCVFRFVIGTDFWETDPQPVIWLMREFQSYPNCQLFLMEQQNGSNFHPKVYLLERSDYVILIVGSSNLTGGGLSENCEADLVIRLEHKGALLRQVREFFDEMIKSGRARLANPFIVGEYEKQYRVHRKYIDSALERAEQKARTVVGRLVQLDDKKLGALLTRYLTDDRESEDLKRRQHNYETAREHLDRIASGQTRSEKTFKTCFLPLVAGSGREGAWYSSGLSRSKNSIIVQWRDFRRVVQFIKAHPEMAPAQLFDEGRKRIAGVYGLGVNILTEIMNTYYPDRCAVLNNNPRSSLEALGATRYPEPNNFKCQDYDRFVSEVAYIKRFGSFASMGQADHFLNYVYWRVVKRKR